MARIAGVDLPRTKRIEIGLSYIFGIGRKRSNDVLVTAGVSPDIRVKDLSEEDVRLMFIEIYLRRSPSTPPASSSTRLLLRTSSSERSFTRMSGLTPAVTSTSFDRFRPIP